MDHPSLVGVAHLIQRMRTRKHVRTLRPRNHQTLCISRFQLFLTFVLFVVNKIFTVAGHGASSPIVTTLTIGMSGDDRLDTHPTRTQGRVQLTITAAQRPASISISSRLGPENLTA